MTRPQLIVAPGKEKALQRRHPWLFSGAVSRVVGKPQEGDCVDVMSASGQWLASGHYQQGSIMCKILSFDSPDIGNTFLRQRIRSAIAYRQRMGFFGNAATNVFRLIHAEGDGLPGLVCDWYAGALVLQAHSAGMHRLRTALVEILVDELTPYGLLSIFDKSEATLPTAYPNPTTDDYLWGERRNEWQVREHNNLILVNFREGQKTGFFIDQRDNRRLVSELSAGHRVLNCFGYTGGFSIAALSGGADMVATVDISRRAIELACRNVSLNFGATDRHHGIVADVLHYLNGQAADAPASSREQYAPKPADFDFIILDPPAFAKSHKHLQQGLKGYRSINQRAMEALPSGGLLMTFSCSQAVSVDDFQTMVFTAAMNAHRRVRIVRRLPHAADHPVSIHHPEGEYLKGLLLEVE